MITMNIRPIEKKDIPQIRYNRVYTSIFNGIIDEFLESDSEAIRFFDDKPDNVSEKEWALETKRVFNNISKLIQRRSLTSKLTVSNRCKNVYLMKKEEDE